MSEKLWLAIIFSCFMAVASLSTCRMHQNSKICRAIEAGVNPIDVKIAFSSGTTAEWIAIRELGRSANGGK